MSRPNVAAFHDPLAYPFDSSKYNEAQAQAVIKTLHAQLAEKDAETLMLRNRLLEAEAKILQADANQLESRLAAQSARESRQTPVAAVDLSSQHAAATRTTRSSKNK